jgi:FkbM family methyltransferase
MTGVLGSDGWQRAPTRTLRCKNHGYLVSLDLSNWSERLSYFLGRHHEIATALFLRAAVSSGDTFIDIGANVGLVTLHAAALVGSDGHVHAFEPNPKLADRLGKVIALNQLRNVTLHATGLSNTAGELTLSILNNHPGQGTLSNIESPGPVTEQYRVPVCVADDVLPGELSGQVIVKIDVEGYEEHVLRGMRRTLDRFRPIVFTEVSTNYLERAGGSVAQLFTLMRLLGYVGYQVTTLRGLFGRALRLMQVHDPAKVMDENIAWLHSKSPMPVKLANLVV